jgi:hypothetical protein
MMSDRYKEYIIREAVDIVVGDDGKKSEAVIQLCKILKEVDDE